MSNESTPTIAFFGATGGVTNACLVHALKSGYKVAALVRTPQKLKDQLAPQGLDEATLSKQLIITEGNALDVAAVKKTLTAGGAGTLVPYIVTGLGGSPMFQFNAWNPLQMFTLDNPHICETAAATVLTALREIHAEQPQLANQKPALIFVSTTGVTRGPEDVPFWMRFLYHQLLAVPHADKKKMENIYRDNVESSDAVLSSVTGIRPTLLMGVASVEDAAGLDMVRAGTEPEPAVGYTIKRADVGHWMFTHLIQDKAQQEKWMGQMVSLTS